MEQPAKLPRGAVSSVFEPNSNTEERRRAAIFRMITAGVSKWVAHGSTRLGAQRVLARGTPIAAGADPDNWLIEAQAARRSGNACLSIRAYEVMVQTTRGRAPDRVGPLLSVRDHFYVTTSLADLADQLSVALPDQFMPQGRTGASMLFGCRIPFNAAPLADVLRSGIIGGLTRAFVAALAFEHAKRGLMVRRVLPHCLWVVPMQAQSDALGIGQQRFGRAELDGWVPQVMLDQMFSLGGQDTFGQAVRFQALRDPTRPAAFAAPGLDANTSAEGQLLMSLCASLLIILCTARIEPDRADADALAALLPSDAQLLDLAEAVADRTSAAVPMQAYMPAMLRLRRNILDISTPGWSTRVWAALQNVSPLPSESALPLAGRFVASFQSAQQPLNVHEAAAAVEYMV